MMAPTYEREEPDEELDDGYVRPRRHRRSDNEYWLVGFIKTQGIAVVIILALMAFVKYDLWPYYVETQKTQIAEQQKINEGMVKALEHIANTQDDILREEKSQTYLMDPRHKGRPPP